MGRVQSATKNIVFGQIGNLVTQLLGFVLRSVFIAHLGDTLVGVNSLYTSILSVLSMAELGIGTALNYSLYKPVANKDYEKIKSYMLLYKKSYRIIGLVVAGIGLAISPFLPYLVKQPDGVTVRDLTLYYFIFLFNTVSTYFVAYKYSLVNAEQKNYIQTNIIKRHRAQVINHLSSIIDDLPEILDHLTEFQLTPDRIHIHQFTAQFCHVNHCRKILNGTVMKFA